MVNACLRLTLPLLSETRQVLQYARSRSLNDEQRSRVHQTFQRLGTWTLLCVPPRGASDSSSNGSDTLASSSDFNPQAWQHFRTSDLTAILRALIAAGDIHRSAIVWRRHHQSDPEIKVDIVEALQACPDSAKNQVLIPWLRSEVLPNLSAHTHNNNLVSWVEQRARKAESIQNSLYDALEWINLLWDSPDTSLPGKVPGDTAITPMQYIGLRMRKATWASKTKFQAQSFHEDNNNDATENLRSEFQEGSILSTLRAQLEDLVHLDKQHSLLLTLEEYVSLTPSTIAIEMLDRVSAPELIKPAYQSHFIPYAQRHNLDSDTMVLEYTLDLMNSSETSTSISVTAQDNGSGGTRASWEHRVLMLLECLVDATLLDKRSPDTCIEILLEMMRRTAIPWSDAVETTIQRFLTLCDQPTLVHPDIHRRESELREQYRLMRLKKMLLSYGVHNFNVSNIKMAKRLLRWILNHTDCEGVLDDALQVLTPLNDSKLFISHSFLYTQLFEFHFIDRRRLSYINKDGGIYNAT